jgi:hypothetical protein
MCSALHLSWRCGSSFYSLSAHYFVFPLPVSALSCLNLYYSSFLRKEFDPIHSCLSSSKHDGRRIQHPRPAGHLYYSNFLSPGIYSRGPSVAHSAAGGEKLRRRGFLRFICMGAYGISLVSQIVSFPIEIYRYPGFLEEVRGNERKYWC